MNSNYLKYLIFKPFKSWKNKYLKFIGINEAKKNNMYDIIAQEIGEYTSESVEVVKQKFKLGPQSENNFSIFKNQKIILKEDVKKFYQSAAFYIYELPLWNAEHNRQGNLVRIILPYLRRNHYKKVLDFGAGAGDLCIELAQRGLDVTYCDISEKLYDFAKWRFKRRNLNIRMIRNLSEGGVDYDCVISFDVFEHIKELPKLIDGIKNKLRKEGGIIFSGAFSGGTLHLEENEIYNEFGEIDNLMSKYYFHFIDKFAQYYFYKKIHFGRLKRRDGNGIR